VVVRVVVDANGQVEPSSAKILRSVPALDASAVEAISRWRFTASHDKSGRPMRVILDVPVAFSLR
jgi:protein TonB